MAGGGKWRSLVVSLGLSMNFLVQSVSALLAVANGGLWCYLWDYQWNFLVQVVSALLAVAFGAICGIINGFFAGASR